jgi:tRNA A-37 threonylcarbamoyl transferase component Bud32
VETDAQLCAACGESVEPPLAPSCPRCGSDPLLRDRYLLIDTVGRGAAGITYRAVEVNGGARVAIKEMAYRHANSVKALELFQREATVLRQLHHSGIPKYLDHFEAGEGKSRALYLVQEFLEGRTLAEEARDRRYSEDEVLAIMDELVEILAYLHGLRPSVIHRDLKPENVMRRASDGKLVLIDFGSVRDAVKDPELGGSTVAGTFGYMAPEQFRGAAERGTDLYAVGALGVALLTRKEPHQMLGPTGQLDWQGHVRVGDHTRDLLSSLLTLDVTDRPSDTAAVRHHIAIARGRATAHAPVESAPPSGASESRSQARAQRRQHRDDRRRGRRAQRAARRDEARASGTPRRRRPLMGFAIAVWVLLSVFVHVPWMIMVIGILGIVFFPRIVEQIRSVRAKGQEDASAAHSQATEGVTLPPLSSESIGDRANPAHETAAESEVETQPEAREVSSS